MNQYGIGQRVAATSSDDSAVVTYAVKNAANGTRAYLIINRSGAYQQVNTDFAGWTPRFATLDRYEISVAGFTQGTLNWATLNSEGLLVPDNSVTLLVAVEKPVKPVLECVAANSDGSYTAFFGYKNENVSPVTLASDRNRFSPAPAQRGQPALFQPGRQQRVFSVVFDGNPLVWSLDGRTATASRNPAQRCR